MALTPSQLPRTGLSNKTINAMLRLRVHFLRVDSSTSIQGIDFQLAHDAVIRGTVIDGAGKPVGDLSVTAVRQEKAANESGHLPILYASRTDSSGQFVLKGLPAATYLVCANGPRGYGAFSKAGASYRETWYGDTASSEWLFPSP